MKRILTVVLAAVMVFSSACGILSSNTETKQSELPNIEPSVSKKEESKSTVLGASPVLTLSVTAEGMIRLAWTKVEEAAKYEVYRAESTDGSYSRIYTTSAGLSCTNTKNVTEGVTYYYKVRALDASGAVGEFSEVVSGKAGAVSPIVTVSLTEEGQIKISWTKVEGAAKYEVFRAESKDGNYTKIYTGTKTLSCTNTKNVVSGTTYYYKVRILDANGKAGIFSDIVSCTAGK